MYEQKDELMASAKHIDVKPNRLSHWILWGAALFILAAMVWANLAVLDEVTTGNGKVIPSSKTQVIQNLEGGIVRQVLVKEGDVVEKGQIIMHIDDTRFNASYKEAVTKGDAYRARIARLSAEAENKPIKLPEELKAKYPELVKNELRLLKARQNEMSSKVTTLKSQLEQKRQELAELTAKQQQLQRSYELIKKELSMTKPLVKEGAVSPVEVLRLERQANDIYGELQSAQIGIPAAQAAVAEAQSKINEFQTSMQTEIIDELTKLKNELAAMDESTVALADKVNRTAVRSPVRGTVKQIYISTIGGVVQPGSELVEIVPLDDTLLIEAQVRPSDIGFIRPGQKATVKISAYDFSIYGGLKATVEHISADTIKNDKDESFYKIYVRTSKNYLGQDQKPLVIIPGMLASVDILTGNKTVMDYLLKPILKAKQNALRER